MMNEAVKLHQYSKTVPKEQDAPVQVLPTLSYKFLILGLICISSLVSLYLKENYFKDRGNHVDYSISNKYRMKLGNAHRYAEHYRHVKSKMLRSVPIFMASQWWIVCQGFYELYKQYLSFEPAIYFISAFPLVDKSAVYYCNKDHSLASLMAKLSSRQRFQSFSWHNIDQCCMVAVMPQLYRNIRAFSVT